MSFEEATTAFDDELSLTIPDPIHSVEEERLLLLGETSRGRLVVVALPNQAPILISFESSQPGSLTAASAMTMKKGKGKSISARRVARDTAPDDILPHYDFSGGVRGKYTARDREGTNVVLLEPDVAQRFPDAASVNRALRGLAEVADGAKPKSRSRRRTA